LYYIILYWKKNYITLYCSILHDNILYYIILYHIILYIYCKYYTCRIEESKRSEGIGKKCGDCGVSSCYFLPFRLVQISPLTLNYKHWPYAKTCVECLAEISSASGCSPVFTSHQKIASSTWRMLLGCMSHHTHVNCYDLFQVWGKYYSALQKQKIPPSSPSVLIASVQRDLSSTSSICPIGPTSGTARLLGHQTCGVPSATRHHLSMNAGSGNLQGKGWNLGQIGGKKPIRMGSNLKKHHGFWDFPPHLGSI
jgi:hypothetical protein